jgi:hypothetical protein
VTAQSAASPDDEPTVHATTHRPRSRRRWDDLIVPWLVGLAATAAFAALSWIGWRDVSTPSWDLGIFTQLAREYSELSAPIVDIKGDGFNLLGDHFHPILVLLGPLYAIHPSGWTLLLAQAALLGLSAVPITSVARQFLGRALGTVLGIAYAFSWGLQGAAFAQFHEIAFGVPLVALALAAFLRGRPVAVVGWAAPLVLVKEDLGLTVAALGAVMVWRAMPPRPPHPPGEPGADRLGVTLDRVDRSLGTTGGRAGATLVLWGAAWLVLSVLVILPALNPGGSYDYVGRIGEADSDWFATLATILWPPQKLLTLVLLALAAGIVGVRSPLMWLLLPTLGWRFLGNVPYYWGWEWHYSAVLVPVVTAGLIDVVGRRGATGAGEEGASSDASEADGPCTGGPGTDGPSSDRPGPDDPPSLHLAPDAHTALRTPAIRAAAVLAAVASTAVMWPRLPLVATFGDGWPEAASRADAAHGAVEAAWAVEPADGEEPVVVSDIFLLAYLVPEARVYWLGNEGNPVPDAVVLDTWQRDGNDTDVEAVAERTFPGWDYAVAYDVDGYAVAELVGVRD